MKALKLYRQLLLLLFCASCVFTQALLAEAPKAVSGSLDLSGYDFLTEKFFKLDGDWLLVHGLVSDPHQAISPDTPGAVFVSQPGIWNRIDYRGGKMPGVGFASQELTVRLPADLVGRVLGVRITHVYMAYDLYINGRLVGSNGRVGRDAASSRPQYLPQVMYFTAEQPELRFTLHISNYWHRKGGLNESITLGLDHNMTVLRERRVIAEMLMVGILGIIGLYHLAIFLFRRSEQTALLFSLFCVLISFRTLLMGERLMYLLVPALPWQVGQALDYLTICLFFSLFIWFVRLLYPAEIPRWIPLVASAASILFIGAILLSKPMFYTRLLTPFNGLMIAVSLPALAGIVRAAIHRKAGARIQLAGIVCLFLAMLNDIFYHLGLLHSTYLMPLGLVLFTIAQTIMLSYLFARAYSIIETMNASLWRFVPRGILQILGKNNIIDIRLGDQINGQLTVLFSDIRGFTKLSESMLASESFVFINSYLEYAGPVIRQHHGFIDKYIGDAILAIFPEGAEFAVRAALALHRATDEFNRSHPQYPDIRIGVGINTGETMLGIIGERERLETTVISDVVNVASRLEEMNKELGSGIAISGAVYDQVSGAGFLTAFRGEVSVRGRSRPVRVYEVKGESPLRLESAAKPALNPG